MKAVILAAGEGTRMAPLTETRPKVLLRVAGKSLLECNLSSLRENNIKEVVNEGMMPPEKFLDRYPEKSLSKEDKEKILKWADEEIAKLME